MGNANTHLSADEIVRYRDRRMPPGELTAADAHLAICDVCHGRMIDFPDLIEKVSSAAKAFDGAGAVELTHLTYEQLAAMADDQLDGIDREVFESHLDLCPNCRAGLNDLRELDSRMAVVARTHAESGRTDRKSLRDNIPRLLRLAASPIPAFWAVAAVLLLLLSLLISIPLRRKNSGILARMAELEQSNAELRERVAATDNLRNELAALQIENERLHRASEADALVAINDGGGRIVLDAQGNLSGPQIEPDSEQAVKDALRRQRVKIPGWLAEIRSQSGTLMGGPEKNDFRTLAPVGVVLESDRPTFRWAPFDLGASYTVAVFDSSLRKVVESDPLTSTEWRPPSALTRGRTYVWQVRATKAGQQAVAPSPTGGRAKFKVLEQSKVARINLATQSAARSHLVMALLYADAGLLSEAEDELHALLKANPDSPTVRKLLQSIRQARR